MSIRRWIVRGIQLLAASLLLLYAADWAILRLRISHGTAFEVIQVHQFLATPLKGQKEEYDYMGDAPVSCSRSIFPQAGNPPCWWLARHTTQWQ
ncbi:hypothetical protein [Granulicella arctica]|uniref:Uncharacterized protein n=1 Tax=Granulicella arctica TaxID=940613 RepID=A0A7Y9PFL5_9BACT|nr:hypothetical protein [Granulicella arctica]NYF78991.1 hypothetical protein [Granulicella arctica]